MICLTFDTDYMRGPGMEDFLRQFPIPGTGTFFLWGPMREVDWRHHEVQPHPCFSNHEEWAAELDEHVQQLGIRPSGLRAHSCAFSHWLGVTLQQRGYKYVSMSTPLFQDQLTAYRHPWGIWELPIYYMDNMDFCMSKNWPELDHRPFDRAIIDRAVHGESLYVFDFHPAHILMNTRTTDDYEKVRPSFISGERSPPDVQYAGKGTRTFFLELCEAMERNNVTSLSCLEALSHSLESETECSTRLTNRPMG